MWKISLVNVVMLSFVIKNVFSEVEFVLFVKQVNDVLGFDV